MLAQLKNLTFLGLMVSILAACGSIPQHYPRPNGHVDKSLVLKTARAQLGTEYAYGGNTPQQGFDCSGLVYYSFLNAGLTLPRTTRGQLRYSRPINRQQLKPGDLLFFRIYRARISHVAIYLGNNRFIHAPSTGKSVSLARLDTPYWRKRFIRGGRI